MIRVAAIGDIHFGRDSAGTWRPALASIGDDADMLLIAGDLTRRGRRDEAEVLAAELRDLPVPVIAVLGNHDFECGVADDLVAALTSAGVAVLQGDTTVVDANGLRVAVAGTVGFGGGFVGASGSDFGEPEMKAFVARTRREAAALEAALRSVADADARIALLHYAPVEDTLVGERLEIYPFLGSYLLAEAVDRAGADLVVHGHAHAGSEKGVTPGGVPVRNVAQPLLGCAYTVYRLDPSR